MQNNQCSDQQSDKERDLPVSSFNARLVNISIHNQKGIPAHIRPQVPIIAVELVVYLKGQGGAEGHVGEGEVNHEDDGRGFGRGTKEEQPHGEPISGQVYGGDEHVDDRDGNAGVSVLKHGQRGVV